MSKEAYILPANKQVKERYCRTLKPIRRKKELLHIGPSWGSNLKPMLADIHSYVVVKMTYPRTSPTQREYAIPLRHKAVAIVLVVVGGKYCYLISNDQVK